MSYRRTCLIGTCLVGGHVLLVDVKWEHEHVIRSRNFDFIRLCTDECQKKKKMMAS